MKFRVLLAATCALALAACSSFHVSQLWPFHKKPKTGPEAVHELNLVNADGSAATYPQYWKRNTLVIDLTGVSGTGSVAARLPEETTWPVRVAVRVRPASVQQLEVQGEERNVLPVSADGLDAIDIELAPSVYTPKTAAIYLAWGPMPMFAEAPPAPTEATPEFVSPTEVPKNAGEDAAPGARDIVTPGEAAPPQPSPPPGD